MHTICKNCKNNFKGNFCGHCGQSSQTHEIGLKSIMHEIQHGIFHVDKGILFTTKELFTRPGHTIREYIEGKRVKHFKPFALVLLLSTVYAVLTHYTNKITFLEEFFLGMTDRSGRDNDSKSLKLFVDVLTWMKNNYAYATLISIPVISTASYLAFIKARYNYFQHLILNCFVAGQRTIVFLLFLPIGSLINNKEADDFFSDVKIIIGILLTFWSYCQFFNSFKPAKKILFTFLSYVYLGVLFMLLSTLLMIVSKIIVE